MTSRVTTMDKPSNAPVKKSITATVRLALPCFMIASLRISRPTLTGCGMSRFLLLDIDERAGAISTLAERIFRSAPLESFADTLSRRPIRRASAAFDIAGDARQIVIPADFAMVIALESRVEADVL